jgi:cysteinyl-tRNA synthetase
MTGRKERLRPAVGRSIGMYVCGVTVYDRCHLGHARSAIVFDLIRRYLKYRKYKIRYVKNFTDVDDKIIHRAQQEGRSWLDVAETYIGAYREDMKRLGVRPADVEPRATEYIAGMIRLIKTLVKKGYAYAVDGDVYFRVKRFKTYGKLSKRKTEELLAGARVEVDERKEDPLDFALWKGSKPGEPTWDSPWGPGRPGWHIECSTMALRLLGPGLTIHGGGKDLIFPHHENEIAQSEGATGRRFARYWVHNGFVNVNREKMSKSLGNFFTIQEIFEKSPWPEARTAEVLRYFLVSTHYRSPIDFSDDALKAAKAALDNFYILFDKLTECMAAKGRGDVRAIKGIKSFMPAFEKAMEDDFNTPGTIAQLQKLCNQINRAMNLGLSKKTAGAALKTFHEYGKILGLFQLTGTEWNSIKVPLTGESATARAGIITPKIDLSGEAVLKLVDERHEARRQKDWARADAIRKQLDDAGVILEDRPDGTTRVRR